MTLTPSNFRQGVNRSRDSLKLSSRYFDGFLFTKRVTTRQTSGITLGQQES